MVIFLSFQTINHMVLMGYIDSISPKHLFKQGNLLVRICKIICNIIVFEIEFPFILVFKAVLSVLLATVRPNKYAQFMCCGLLLYFYTETEMSSFLWNFHHWLHWKLSKWQLSVQTMMKISSKWRHFQFNAAAMWWNYNTTTPKQCAKMLCIHY